MHLDERAYFSFKASCLFPPPSVSVLPFMIESSVTSLAFTHLFYFHQFYPSSTFVPHLVSLRLAGLVPLPYSGKRHPSGQTLSHRAPLDVSATFPLGFLYSAQTEQLYRAVLLLASSSLPTNLDYPLSKKTFTFFVVCCSQDILDDSPSSIMAIFDLIFHHTVTSDSQSHSWPSGCTDCNTDPVDTLLSPLPPVPTNSHHIPTCKLLGLDSQSCLSFPFLPASQPTRALPQLSFVPFYLVTVFWMVCSSCIKVLFCWTTFCLSSERQGQVCPLQPSLSHPPVP